MFINFCVDGRVKHIINIFVFKRDVDTKKRLKTSKEGVMKSKFMMFLSDSVKMIMKRPLNMCQKRVVIMNVKFKRYSNIL